VDGHPCITLYSCTHDACTHDARASQHHCTAQAAGYAVGTALQLVLPFYTEVAPARHAMQDGSAAVANLAHDDTFGRAREWSGK
jgi:hypothetical protein